MRRDMNSEAPGSNPEIVTFFVVQLIVSELKDTDNGCVRDRVSQTCSQGTLYLGTISSVMSAKCRSHLSTIRCQYICLCA